MSMENKKCYAVIGSNNLDGVFIHGVFEEWYDAVKTAENKEMRIRETVFIPKKTNKELGQELAKEVLQEASK